MEDKTHFDPQTTKVRGPCLPVRQLNGPMDRWDAGTTDRSVYIFQVGLKKRVCGGGTLIKDWSPKTRHYYFTPWRPAAVHSHHPALVICLPAYLPHPSKPFSLALLPPFSTVNSPPLFYLN